MRITIALLLRSLGLAAPLTFHCLRLAGQSATPPAASPNAYRAVVTRTQFGIPHIQADDFGGLGYGFGYAFAEDNLCTTLENYLTIRGERSRYWGGNGAYTTSGNGVTIGNVDSDFFWKLTASDSAVERLRIASDRRLKEIVTGYASGFNRYVRELREGSHPGRHAACAGASWLNDISEGDVYRRLLALSVLASSSALQASITAAHPPSVTAGARLRAGEAPGTPAEPNHLPDFRNPRGGSNMYALGSHATQNGVPIILANPHFPWFGADRLYLAQLTIPGVLDVEGVGLYGAPLILVGFNDRLAWSHTVSTAYRFTIYQLQLNPANPTEYLFNGGYVRMQAVPLSIRVLQPDGAVVERTRILYKSHYGPMLTLQENGQTLLGWNSTQAYTLRDANLENTRIGNQYLLWNMARNLDEFKHVHRTIIGVPWLNTVASGPSENVYYADLSVVPNVTDAHAGACAALDIPVAIRAAFPGLPVLDGARAECAWQTDSDAPAPGVFGPSHLPVLERNDWLANMNDSYWLTNPAQPLTGFSRIIGDEATPRRLRTRLGILQIQRRLAGNDGLPGKGFSAANLQQTVLNANVYSGELARNAVVNGFCASPAAADVRTACSSLALWDQTAGLSSIGFPVWQEFWTRLNGAPDIWKVPFNPQDAVNTPNTLAVDDSLVVHQALLQAQIAVQSANPQFFAAPLGAFQYSGVNFGPGNQRLPIFGGLADPLGIFAAAESPTGSIGSAGYPVVLGNSYLHVVTWNAGKVVASGFLAYSESTDPANPHFADFTSAYSKREWQPLPFHPNEIQALRESRVELVAR